MYSTRKNNKAIGNKSGIAYPYINVTKTTFKQDEYLK